jgi:hypothetical protein
MIAVLPEQKTATPSEPRGGCFDDHSAQNVASLDAQLGAQTQHVQNLLASENANQFAVLHYGQLSDIGVIHHP